MLEQGPLTLQPGSVLNKRYRVTRIIHVGSVSTIYQARDLRYEDDIRYVAIKERLNLTTDTTMRMIISKSFEREADMMAALSHPSAPQIFDYFAGTTIAFLVMEHINGRNLQEIMDALEAPIPVATVYQWAIKLLDILKYLHQHDPPIVHRNLQPTSVMIDEDEDVRLVDFSIACIHTGKPGAFIGPEGFMAPEQPRRQSSPASDVYGVGALLHYLLTRSDPRESPSFTWHERPIRRFNPHVPRAFSAIISRALEFEAGDRYPDAAAMLTALRAI